MSGGALVEVGREVGHAAGAVGVQVEGLFQGGDQVAERFGVTEMDGQRCAVDEGGACGELCSAYSAEQGGLGDVDAGVDECCGDALSACCDDCLSEWMAAAQRLAAVFLQRSQQCGSCLRALGVAQDQGVVVAGGQGAGM